MIYFTTATEKELPDIIRLLADDELGVNREEYTEPLLPSYVEAFHRIDNDPREELVVAMDEDKVIGCLQLSIIPYLTYKGSSRAQIEGVRIDSKYRGQGIGKQLIEYAIERSRRPGVIMVQLTSTATRENAIRFYENLGFKPTHIGMKLLL